jgi:chemotaxis signal transduction protein
MTNKARTTTGTMAVVAASVAALTFRLGRQEYAILIENVLEVTAMVEVTHLPEARAGVLGVINRRGDVLTLIDLRHVFNQSITPIDVSTLFIVAQDGPGRIGLVVDEILQVEYYDLTHLQPHTTGALHGIIGQGERLVQLIAVAPLISVYAQQG